MTNRIECEIICGHLIVSERDEMHCTHKVKVTIRKLKLIILPVKMSVLRL